MNKKEYDELVSKNVKNESARKQIVAYKDEIKAVAIASILLFAILAAGLLLQLDFTEQKLETSKLTSLELANKVCDSKNMGEAFQVYTYNNGMIIECYKGSIRYTR